MRPGRLLVGIPLTVTLGWMTLQFLLTELVLIVIPVDGPIGDILGALPTLGAALLTWKVLRWTVAN